MIAPLHLIFKIKVRKVHKGSHFLFVMFDQVHNGRTPGQHHVTRKGSALKLVVQVQKTNKSHARNRQRTHGIVDLRNGATLQPLLIGDSHEFFVLDDDVVEVKKLSPFKGGGIADGLALEIKTMFIGIEIAGLGTAFVFGGRILVGHFNLP